MPRLICLHSFRRGTGKSTLTSNLAVLLAQAGQRVGVFDANLYSPAQQLLFNLPDARLSTTLNDFLWGQTASLATYELTAMGGSGRVWLVPAATNPTAIRRVIREGLPPQRLREALAAFAAALTLDVVLMDTPAGLNPIALTMMAEAHRLHLIFRPDAQDYTGTGIVVDVARQLAVPTTLIVNEVPPTLSLESIRAQAHRAYDCPLAALLPHVPELTALASAELFVIVYPRHPLTQNLKTLAAQL